MSQNGPSHHMAEEYLSSARMDMNLEKNENYPGQGNFGVVGNGNEEYQQVHGLMSDQQDGMMPSSAVQVASNGARSSNKKQKSKKPSIASRSAYLNRSRGGHVPTFSHQYEVQHNTNGSAFSSEFVVTQNLSPGAASQIDTAAAKPADPRLNSLPNAILQSKQNQHQARSLRPAGLSN